MICQSNSVPAKTQLLSHTGRSSANLDECDKGQTMIGINDSMTENSRASRPEQPGPQPPQPEIPPKGPKDPILPPRDPEPPPNPAPGPTEPGLPRPVSYQAAA